MRQDFFGVASWQRSEAKMLCGWKLGLYCRQRYHISKVPVLGMQELFSGQNTPNRNLTAYKSTLSCALKYAVSTESEAISKADAERISQQCQGKE